MQILLFCDRELRIICWEDQSEDLNPEMNPIQNWIQTPEIERRKVFICVEIEIGRVIIHFEI